MDKSEEKIYIDGFSERKDNVLQVSDKLFFCEPREVDLNAVYDTKNKKYEVRGLIRILDNYKFTIAENTPIEEEIALDPELLGKVFENLLANYNPETKTTARKQTGSFYTPREIGNYMVDESLIAYLKAKLEVQSPRFSVSSAETETQAKQTQGDFFEEQTALKFVQSPRFSVSSASEARRNQTEVWTLNGTLNDALRDLFSYSETEHQFSDAEIDIIIRAINDCKILDPACGSGAFPMGILQRLVFLLGKLDKDNVKWRELQRQIAVKETDEAFKIGDVNEREKRLLEISEVFENNASDYGRKLFLIENCIYGVDIQPVAIQISKLRFFISLIIDQKIDDTRPNRGVRPLPNLETKLVAANTLIGLEDSTQITIARNAVRGKEAELRKVRSAIFRARTPSTKKRLRDEDKRIRAEIAQLLKDNDFFPDAADKIADWSPDNQDTNADWFDAEWMFGIEKGFDIVIGNPPYVFARNSESKQMTVADKKYFYQNYILAEYQVNLYPLFVENSTNNLKKNGILSFITPNNWLTINTNKILRKFVLDKSDVKIVNFYARVFESADVDCAIIIFRNSTNNHHISLFEYVENFVSIKETNADFFLKQRDYIINIEALKGNETIAFLHKLENLSDKLSDVASIKVGLGAYGINKGIPPQTKEMIENRIFHSTYKIDKTYFKYLEGKDVSRYYLDWSGEYLKHGNHLREPRGNWDLFSTKRILVRQIPAKPPYCIHACLAEEVLLNDRNSMNVINIKELPEMILGILNSRLISYWFVHKFGKMQRGVFPQFKANELADFPLPKNRKTKQAEIAEIVDEIIEAKKRDASADTKELECKIDKLVYRLYDLTDEERAIVEGRSGSESKL